MVVSQMSVKANSQSRRYRQLHGAWRHAETSGWTRGDKWTLCATYRNNGVKADARLPNCRPHLRGQHAHAGPAETHMCFSSDRWPYNACI